MNKIVDLVSLAQHRPTPNHEVSGGFSAMVDGQAGPRARVLGGTVVIEHQKAANAAWCARTTAWSSLGWSCSGQPQQRVFGPRQWRPAARYQTEPPRVGPRPRAKTRRSSSGPSSPKAGPPHRRNLSSP